MDNLLFWAKWLEEEVTSGCKIMTVPQISKMLYPILKLCLSHGFILIISAPFRS